MGFLLSARLFVRIISVATGTNYQENKIVCFLCRALHALWASINAIVRRRGLKCGKHCAHRQVLNDGRVPSNVKPTRHFVRREAREQAASNRKNMCSGPENKQSGFFTRNLAAELPVNP